MTAANFAASSPDRTPARVRLRPTMQSDLEFVLSLEQDPENLPFITPGSAPSTKPRSASRISATSSSRAAPDLDAVGFLILIGCRSQHQSLELKRMVVQAKGAGYGRAALRVAKKVAFDDLGAHRFWLDVKARNTPRQGLTTAKASCVEGELREAVKVQSGFDSLIVMSMLRHEFAGRRSLGLEMRA